VKHELIANSQTAISTLFLLPYTALMATDTPSTDEGRPQNILLTVKTRGYNSNAFAPNTIDAI
jgi:hypothetical protein